MTWGRGIDIRGYETRRMTLNPECTAPNHAVSGTGFILCKASRMRAAKTTSMLKQTKLLLRRMRHKQKAKSSRMLATQYALDTKLCASQRGHNPGTPGFNVAGNVLHIRSLRQITSMPATALRWARFTASSDWYIPSSPQRCFIHSADTTGPGATAGEGPRALQNGRASDTRGGSGSGTRWPVWAIGKSQGGQDGMFGN